MPQSVIVSEAVSNAKSRLQKLKTSVAKELETIPVLAAPSEAPASARTIVMADVSSTAVQSKKALRRIFLKYTRESEDVSMSLPVFLKFAGDAKIENCLLNDAELTQSFEAAQAGATLDISRFLRAIEICALAFQRPPHNVKIDYDGTTTKLQLQLWRYLGLHDGSWRDKFQHVGEFEDLKFEMHNS